MILNTSHNVPILSSRKHLVKIYQNYKVNDEKQCLCTLDQLKAKLIGIIYYCTFNLTLTSCIFEHFITLRNYMTFFNSYSLLVFRI